MYADDASLCYKSSDMTQLNEAINNDLKALDTWLQGNKLTFNLTKTHFMLLSTKQKRKILESRNGSMDLKIRDNELREVQNTSVYILTAFLTGKSKKSKQCPLKSPELLPF